jgi:hypothetical protein
MKESLSSGTAQQEAETTEFVVNLPIKSTEMNQWLAQNREWLNLVINCLLERMYNAERLPKP